jgi:hypothetical protein
MFDHVGEFGKHSKTLVVEIVDELHLKKKRHKFLTELP